MGLATLLFLAVAAVTGCILCFTAPLDAALNPDLFHRPVQAAPIDPVRAATALEAARPELRVYSFPLNLKPGQTLEVQVGGRDAKRPLGYDQVFVDAGDGHVAGVRALKAGWDRRGLVQGVFELHYTLLAGDWGRWLMGICAGGWLLGNLVGVYLTWPRRPPILRNWWKAWLVKPGGRLGKFLLDLHQASGLWLIGGLTVLAFTSVAMNFFSEAFTPAVNALSRPKPSPFDQFDRPVKPTGPLIGFARALDDGTAAARARGGTWRPAAVGYHPTQNIYRVTFTRSGFVSYRGLGPVSYYVDGSTGRFVYEENPYTDSVGLKVSRSLYPLHSGKVAGAAGVAVIFLLGLATLEMCVTGAWVWWKRRGPRVAARRARR